MRAVKEFVRIIDWCLIKLSAVMVFVSKIARCLIELRAVKEFVRIIVRCLIKLSAVMEFVSKFQGILLS